MTELAIPCRYIIIDCSMYHTCSLLDGCICQVINPYLTDTTFHAVVKPSEISLTGHPDKGNLEAKVTDLETEILSVERPPEIHVLDTECPAGYTWRQACAKFEAVWNLCHWDMDDEEVARINALISNMHEPNIKEAE